MIEELKSLGLSSYEAKAVDAILKQELTLKELSRRAGIPFGRVYSVIKDLQRKGIYLEHKGRPKVIRIRNASETISELIRKKQERDRQINEGLREIATVMDKERNRDTKFFEIGVAREENKKIQMRVFKEAEEEILQIFNIYHNPQINRQNKLEYEKEIEKAVERGVLFKAIYPKKIELPKILNKLEKDGKFKVRRLDTDFTRCDIADGKKVLIKLAQKDVVNSGGSIFVENEKLAENLTRIFNELWERAD